MLNLYQKVDEHRPIILEQELSDEEVLDEIVALKKELKDEVIVLGHHYQQDDVIRFADATGDSLYLAQKAAQLQNPYIVFCGVHFMAETADILTRDDQHVLLPDLKAGCSMADMASLKDILVCKKRLEGLFGDACFPQHVVPVTYVNSSASLKSFVGEHGGSICTSSNARLVIEWALKQGEKLLFFPDQHLGRNTCFEMGIPLEEMVLYDPRVYQGNVSDEQLRKAKVILWAGHCSVHQGFQASQIDIIRKNTPEMKILVHPECSFDVVQKADQAGSTAFIIDTIRKAPAGTSFAVGTEINLVNRLAQEMPDKLIISLSPYQCLCTTMYRIRPRWLLESFRSIKRRDPQNVIKVPEQDKYWSRVALQRMLGLATTIGAK
jgi:quinolinate synthase